MDTVYGNIRIREAVPADAAQLCAWWNDGDVMAHAGFPRGLGVTEADVEAKLRIRTEANRIHMILEDGMPVGEMNYRDRGGGVMEIGIKICLSSAQNRGLGRIVLRLFVGELFRAGACRILLDTDLENTRAQHVYEQLGFRRMRVCRDSWRDQLGELRSSVEYELTEEDFVPLPQM